MKVTGITAGIGGTNCYIADNEDGSCYIIDAADHLAVLLSSIKERRLKPLAVLLTHAHYDHILGLGEIREEYPGLPIYLAREDEFLIKDGCSGNISILGRYSPLTELLKELPDDTIPYREEIGQLKVIRTPGHTPGSVCLYSEKDSILFSGDTLFAGSIGRCDLGGSYSDIITSIEKLKKLPDSTRVLPGHGGYSTIDEEKRTNPYFF